MNWRASHVLPVGLTLGLSLSLLACEEEKKEEPKVEQKAAEPEPEPEPVEESPPHLVISESGPSVRGASIMVEKKTGLVTPPGLDKLRNYLNDEKKFLDGKELTVIVDRKAKRGWVGTYLAELSKMGAAKFIIKTETRKEFPPQIEFAPSSQGSGLDGCTVIGAITEKNGSALWKLKGGTARSRGPGLGGPDLSMAKETIATLAKGCDSDVFVTDAANDKNWGFVYDMAAAAITTPEVGIKKALLPAEPQTAGRKASL